MENKADAGGDEEEGFTVNDNVFVQSKDQSRVEIEKIDLSITKSN